MIKTCNHFKTSLTNLTDGTCPYCEIDELRAALSDRRDSELRWKASCGTFSELMTKCQTKLAAQRKVLEQALDAMVNHGSPYMGLHIKDYEAAITAIQGVLK